MLRGLLLSPLLPSDVLFPGYTVIPHSSKDSWTAFSAVRTRNTSVDLKANHVPPRLSVPESVPRQDDQDLRCQPWISRGDGWHGRCEWKRLFLRVLFCCTSRNFGLDFRRIGDRGAMCCGGDGKDGRDLRKASGVSTGWGVDSWQVVGGFRMHGCT
jgi:hypothetical protein